MNSLHNKTNAKLCVSLCCCILPAAYRKEKCEENLWKAFRWSWYLEAPLSIVGKEPTKMANDENKGKCKVIQIWNVCNSRVMILKGSPWISSLNEKISSLWHYMQNMIALHIPLGYYPNLIVCLSESYYSSNCCCSVTPRGPPLPGFPTGFPWIHLRGSHGLRDQRARRTK